MKMSFNPGLSKYDQEVTFNGKLIKVTQPSVVCSNANASQYQSQQHPDMMIDLKLAFKEH